MRNEVLRMEKITLREQGVTLLQDFNLNVFCGEIMGLLPIDDQGLSALCGLLRDNAPLGYGYVFYREEQINTWRAPRPRSNRISVIQAKSCLVDGLTVADNVFVLRPGFRGRIMRAGFFRRQLEPFLKTVGVSVSADTRVDQLSTFQRFVVELLKAVVAGNRLIVLKEVGTFISEWELNRLHAILRLFAAKGFSFLYIGFHFEEQLQICDRTALMINGRVVKVLQGDEMNVQSILPYSESFDKLVRTQLSRSARGIGDEVFSAQGLCYGRIHGLRFSVRAGECLVLQDLDNHLIDDLLALLSGERLPEGGRMLLKGKPFFPKQSRDVAIVQEQPTKTMVFDGLSYLDNLCFTMDHRISGVWRSWSLRAGLARAYGQWIGPELLERRVDSLTEGERYELVYRRVLLQHPQVAFCVQPFRMADVALRMRIWEQLEALLQSGVAVVILAVNLADSLSLADRLIRVGHGKPQEEYDRSHFDDIPVSASAPWTRMYLYETDKDDRGPAKAADGGA